MNTKRGSVQAGVRGVQVSLTSFAPSDIEQAALVAVIGIRSALASETGGEVME
jgi:hypothetical protein